MSGPLRLETSIYTREEALLSVQNHGRRHLVSEVSPFGSIRNKMAAQCLLSSISRPLAPLNNPQSQMPLTS